MTAADDRAALPGRWTDDRDRKPMPCMDCHVDTFDEYYVIQHWLWTAAVGHHRAGYLCIVCLETRVGRPLDAADFLGCPANDLTWRKTPRLLERMTRYT